MFPGCCGVVALTQVLCCGLHDVSVIKNLLTFVRFCESGMIETDVAEVSAPSSGPSEVSQILSPDGVKGSRRLFSQVTSCSLTLLDYQRSIGLKSKLEQEESDVIRSRQEAALKTPCPL